LKLPVLPHGGIRAKASEGHLVTSVVEREETHIPRKDLMSKTDCFEVNTSLAESFFVLRKEISL
jgi:hypothetical protein